MAGWIQGPRDFSVHPGTGIMQYGTAATANMFGLITSSNAPGALYFYGHSRDLAGGSLVPPDPGITWPSPTTAARPWRDYTSMVCP